MTDTPSSHNTNDASQQGSGGRRSSTSESALRGDAGANPAAACPDNARRYAMPYHVETIHLVAFESAGSVASMCGRSWPLRDAGISTTKPVGPLCLPCRQSEARRLRDAQ